MYDKARAYRERYSDWIFLSRSREIVIRVARVSSCAQSEKQICKFEIQVGISYRLVRNSIIFVLQMA